MRYWYSYRSSRASGIVVTVVAADDIQAGARTLNLLTADLPDLTDYGVYDEAGGRLGEGWNARRAREGDAAYCHVCGARTDEDEFLKNKGRCPLHAAAPALAV